MTSAVKSCAVINCNYRSTRIAQHRHRSDTLSLASSRLSKGIEPRARIFAASNHRRLEITEKERERERERDPNGRSVLKFIDRVRGNSTENRVTRMDI